MEMKGVGFFFFLFLGAAISICQSSTITAVTEEINAVCVPFTLIATTAWWVSQYYGWIQASSIFLFTSSLFLFKASGKTLLEQQYLFLIFGQIMWMHLNIMESLGTLHSCFLNIPSLCFAEHLMHRVFVVNPIKCVNIWFNMTALLTVWLN